MLSSSSMLSSSHVAVNQDTVKETTVTEAMSDEEPNLADINSSKIDLEMEATRRSIRIMSNQKAVYTSHSSDDIDGTGDEASIVEANVQKAVFQIDIDSGRVIRRFAGINAAAVELGMITYIFYQ